VSGTEWALEMVGISKRFPGVAALDRVDFRCRRGEVHALMGANGAGKSTLMKILAGAVLPDEGEIRINGQRVQFSTPEDAIRHGVAIIYQELSLSLQLSVAENVFLGRYPRTRLGLVDWPGMYKAARELLDSLGVPMDVRRPAAELSLGQRQILELAKALSLNAQILVMDEPSAALTEAEFATLVRVVHDLRRQGRTIIYISHRLEEVFQLADRVTVLRDGRKVAERDVAELDRASLAELMVGRPIVAGTPAAPARRDAQPLLRVQGLRNGRLKQLDLEVAAGEVVGLFGLVGSGRSEALRGIFAADQAAYEAMWLEGNPVRFRSPYDAIRAGIALVPEDRKLEGVVLARPVWENLAVASYRYLTRRGVVHYPLVWEKVSSIMERLQIKAASRDVLTGTLSGGNQQKVAIGKWLVRLPKVVLLDEPTRGIDIGAKEHVYHAIHELAAEGVAVVVASSEIDELLRLCDRILVLYQGRLAGAYPRNETLRETILQCALTGGEA